MKRPTHLRKVDIAQSRPDPSPDAAIDRPAAEAGAAPDQSSYQRNLSERSILFLDTLRQRAGTPPVLYGNCQAGWAVTLLAADCKGLTGPVVLNGSPLSYWAGEAAVNPMRVSSDPDCHKPTFSVRFEPREVALEQMFSLLYGSGSGLQAPAELPVSGAPEPEASPAASSESEGSHDAVAR